MTAFKATEKERLVNAFLRGESVTDLSAFFAVQRGTIETVLREAIVQLAQLNRQQYTCRIRPGASSPRKG